MLSVWGTVPLNKWTYIATTYDGTNVKFYINGSLDSTQALAQSQLNSSATFFKIGAESWVTGYWQGDIDTVRIFGGVFTASEVQRIYAEEKEQFLAMNRN